MFDWLRDVNSREAVIQNGVLYRELLNLRDVIVKLWFLLKYNNYAERGENFIRIIFSITLWEKQSNSSVDCELGIPGALPYFGPAVLEDFVPHVCSGFNSAPTTKSVFKCVQKICVCLNENKGAVEMLGWLKPQKLAVVCENL